MLLRIVLNFTVGISIFNFGMLFDLILTAFWIGAFAFFIKKTRNQRIYYIAVVVIASIFVIGDSIYYDFFDVISSRSSFGGFNRLAEGNTLEYNLQIPLAAYIVLPLLGGVIYLLVIKSERDIFHIKDFGIIILIFLLQIVLFLVWGSYNFDTRNEYYRSDAYLFETMYDRTLFSEKYGYYNYHILDITRLKASIDEEEFYKDINAYFEDKTTHETNDFSDVYAGYNVISILGETLETRFIDPILTPNLYMMKNEGYSFDNYYTTVFQQGATCNSEFMSLTGLNAIASNDWINNVCDSYSENTFTYALPNQLESIGYNTYYFHSGYEWFYNRQIITPQYGFTTVKFQEDLYKQGYDDFDDKYDTQMLYFFDEYVNYDEPFFINLLTYSMHGAYNQEEFYKYYDIVEEAHPGETLDGEIINYMAKLVEFDNMIGLILDELEENGQLDNTLFVIYPDHHPYMMTKETYFDYIDVELDSHEFMRQDLIIYATNMTGNIVSMTGSTLDIAPTILNLIDSSLNFNYFTGVDLLSNQDNYVLFSDLTITDGYNYLFLNQELVGNGNDLAILEVALEEKINELELQKKALIIDYFKKLKENQ